jgi:4,5-DOPA dioxygenase extradiol
MRENMTDVNSHNVIMPVLFIGHGSPMNAVMSNTFTEHLSAAGKAIKPRPAAILVVSAHWLTTDGSYVSTTPKPDTIYDFSGFPDELYNIVYPAPGSPATAELAIENAPYIKQDPSWGLDHGAWTILKHLYPQADIPVCQLSIDYHKPMSYHFELGKKLGELRKQGVLIIGSGNIVHNLMLIDFDDNAKPFDWAVEFDSWVKSVIDSRNFEDLLSYEKMGRSAKLSVPTVDHYVPLLYTLGAAGKDEPFEYFHEGFDYSTLSMRCLKAG